MNIDKQYKKTPNQYLHENMVWTLCSVLLLVAELRGTEGHRSCSPDMWQSCHSVQQPQERGRHLSKGSAGAHGNKRGVMSPLGRACVHEWLRRDTAPLNVTYTLSFIIVSRLLTLSDSDAAPFFDDWTITVEVICTEKKKTWLFLDLFVRRFFFSKA